MEKRRFEIDNIPAVLWGKQSEHVFIAVHGNMSYKEDTVIEVLAEASTGKGYQVLSFDLPEHGERSADDTPCKVQICVRDLKSIMKYAKEHWNKISLFACSMGAYFSLLSYNDEKIEQSLFLSPVVDMERIITNMMMWFDITPERLQNEGEINTPIGQKLYWDYYCYVVENPIVKWNCHTSILYGSKDDLCEYDTIEHFASQFHCELVVMEQGEHYFHTQEQLDIFRSWLKKFIK